MNSADFDGSSRSNDDRFQPTSSQMLSLYSLQMCLYVFLIIILQFGVQKICPKKHEKLSHLFCKLSTLNIKARNILSIPVAPQWPAFGTKNPILQNECQSFELWSFFYHCLRFRLFPPDWSTSSMSPPYYSSSLCKTNTERLYESLYFKFWLFRTFHFWHFLTIMSHLYVKLSTLNIKATNILSIPVAPQWPAFGTKNPILQNEC